MSNNTNNTETYPKYRFNYYPAIDDLCIEVLGYNGSHIVDPEDGEYWKMEMESKVLYDLAYPDRNYGLYNGESAFWQSNSEKCVKAQDEYLAIKKEKTQNVWKEEFKKSQFPKCLFEHLPPAKSPPPPRRKKNKKIKLIVKGGE